MLRKTESGAAHILIVIAAVGVLVFIAVASIGGFSNQIYSTLFSRPQSHAKDNIPLKLEVIKVNPPQQAVKTGYEKSHKPIQQIEVVFNKDVRPESVLVDVSPQISVALTQPENQRNTVILTPDETWLAGDTTITILPDTRALDGTSLSAPFIYTLSAGSKGDPLDVEKY